MDGCRLGDDGVYLAGVELAPVVPGRQAGEKPDTGVDDDVVERAGLVVDDVDGGAQVR